MESKYTVTGMSCAACQSHVERAVRSVPGMETAAVNLLTGELRVTGTADPRAIRKAVTDAGYGLSDRAEEETLPKRDDGEEQQKRRLILSVCLTVPLLYAAMGMPLLHLPGWQLAEQYPGAFRAVCALTALCVLWINRRYFVHGFRGLIHGAPNMDTLVSIGSAASFLGGYYDSVAMILTLISVGKMLEARSRGKTTDAVRGLIRLKPETARVFAADGTETVIPAAELSAGDIFLLKPGDRIPADGTVLEGDSAVDESMLTGEACRLRKRREAVCLPQR